MQRGNYVAFLQRMFVCLRIESRTVEIPGDLWFEILLKVPAKFIIKFRSLSKFHRDLIDSPDFRQKHADLLSACSHVILGRRTRSNVNVNVDYQVMKLDPTKFGTKVEELFNSWKEKGYSILCCCLGILCLLYFPKHKRDGHILLWNPLTGSCSRRIPVKYEISSSRWYSSYFMGHDATVDDLKVLKVSHKNVESNDPGDYDCEIYSSRTDSWRKMTSDSCDYPNLDFSLSSGVFVEGTSSVHLSPYEDITAFNFCSDKFDKIPMPRECYLEVGMSCLDGLLCVYTKWVPNWEVWVMKEYGVEESWTRLFSLGHSVANMFLLPLRFVNDGRMLLILSTRCHKYEFGVQVFDFTKRKMIKKSISPSTSLLTTLNELQHILYTPSLRRV